MKHGQSELEFAIEVRPGEKLALPQELVESVGPGRWIVSVRPWDETDVAGIRLHDAFLRGYAPEDEGLYDDLAR